jgi:hypothetical protein
MPEYVKGFLPAPLNKPASALLENHLKLFTLNQLRAFEQTLYTLCIFQHYWSIPAKGLAL